MRIIQVVGAVIFLENKVLACRRAPHKNLAGLFEFPGGKIEPTETPQQALERELREELSTNVSVHESIGGGHSVVGDTKISLECFRCSLNGAVPTHSSDHDRLVWVTIDQIDKLDWAEADMPVLSAVRAILETQNPLNP